MSKTILVVEDEIIIADHLCLELRKNGYTTPEPALDYQEAIGAINQYAPDLVILDIDLNDEHSGIDLGILLNDEFDIPFIYLTSSNSRDTLESAKLTLPYAYLSKPFRPMDIIASVELALINHTLAAKRPVKEEVESLNALTTTEKIVLRKISSGLTTKVIAQQLGVSPNTVKNHRYNICCKLKLNEGTHSLKYWVIEHQFYIQAMVH